MAAGPPLRRRLLVRLALLFACAQLVAAVALVFLLPAMRSETVAAALVLSLVIVDLTILIVFSGWIIRGSVVNPMERFSEDVRRIAAGDYRHRIGDHHGMELRAIRNSVNRMADRLIADQALLAENVRSLEETNRELVDARDQIVRSARLASVGTLAAGIAHEVGNPLGAIMAFVDVARSRAAKTGVDPDLLDSIREEANRIDRIVRGLLDYARPAEVEAAPTSPAVVLRGVRELLGNQGKLDRIEHVWEISDDVPDVVMEPHRLQQVIVNLVLNALHALEEVDSGRILVRVHDEEGEAARLPARREGDPAGINYRHRRRLSTDERMRGVDPVYTARRVAVIEVSDNGPGIAEEDLERVFDPFFTTKEPGKGTGLGLSICARLVEGMGGRIDAGRAPEGGARFVIRLPGSDGGAVPATRRPQRIRVAEAS